MVTLFFQTDCSEWVETCLILLAGLQRGPPEGQTDAHVNGEEASCSHVPALPVDSIQAPVRGSGPSTRHYQSN